MRVRAHLHGAGVAVCAAAGLTLFAAPAAAGDPHPDLLISKHDVGGYVGQGQYDPPTPQTVTKTAKVGKTKRVFIKVQLDGTPGLVPVKGPASDSDLKLRYYRGNNNVTQKITSPTGLPLVLELGESRKLTLKFTPKPGISDVSIVISAQNGPNLDQVGLVLNVP